MNTAGGIKEQMENAMVEAIEFGRERRKIPGKI